MQCIHRIGCTQMLLDSHFQFLFPLTSSKSAGADRIKRSQGKGIKSSKWQPEASTTEQRIAPKSSLGRALGLEPRLLRFRPRTRPLHYIRGRPHLPQDPSRNFGTLLPATSHGNPYSNASNLGISCMPLVVQCVRQPAATGVSGISTLPGGHT